jgi:hypothetical protein
MSDLSPAEQRAIREGLPIVPAVVHELMTAASGNPIIVRTLAGDEVLLRLPTVGELMQFNRDALASLPEAIRPEPMSRARAEELSAPLQLPGWSS